MGLWQPRCVEVTRERGAFRSLITEGRLCELAKLPIAISARLAAEHMGKLERQRARILGINRAPAGGCVAEERQVA